MLEGVIYQVLVADSLASDCAVYKSARAIFTTSLPEDCGFPAILISNRGGTSWGARAKEGFDVAINVSIYRDKLRSRTAVRELAWKVWKLLNRNKLSPYIQTEGYDCWVCLADPPVLTNDDENFPGYTVTVRVKGLES